MEKQKTAVEWMIERLTIDFDPETFMQDVIPQAFEMEKQQIVNAWFSGYLNGEIKAELKSEEYYNENFKP